MPVGGAKLVKVIGTSPLSVKPVSILSPRTAPPSANVVMIPVARSTFRMRSLSGVRDVKVPVGTYHQVGRSGEHGAGRRTAVP